MNIQLLPKVGRPASRCVLRTHEAFYASQATAPSPPIHAAIAAAADSKIQKMSKTIRGKRLLLNNCVNNCNLLLFHLNIGRTTMSIEEELLEMKLEKKLDMKLKKLEERSTNLEQQLHSICWSHAPQSTQEVLRVPWCKLST